MNKFAKTIGAAVIGILSLTWSQEKVSDYQGFWVADIEASQAMMSAAEKDEISKLPKVVLNMMNSIVVELGDNQVVLNMLGEREQAKCQPFEIKNKRLHVKCTANKEQKERELIAELVQGKLRIVQMNGSKNAQVEKVSFKRVTQVEAQTAIKSAPSKEEFQALMMKMMQEAFAQQLMQK